MSSKNRGPLDEVGLNQLFRADVRGEDDVDDLDDLDEDVLAEVQNYYDEDERLFQTSGAGRSSSSSSAANKPLGAADREDGSTSADGKPEEDEQKRRDDDGLSTAALAEDGLSCENAANAVVAASSLNSTKTLEQELFDQFRSPLAGPAGGNQTAEASIELDDDEDDVADADDSSFRSQSESPGKERDIAKTQPLLDLISMTRRSHELGVDEIADGDDHGRGKTTPSGAEQQQAHKEDEQRAAIVHEALQNLRNVLNMSSDVLSKSKKNHEPSFAFAGAPSVVKPKTRIIRDAVVLPEEDDWEVDVRNFDNKKNKGDTRPTRSGTSRAGGAAAAPAPEGDEGTTTAAENNTVSGSGTVTSQEEEQSASGTKRRSPGKNTAAAQPAQAQAAQAKQTNLRMSAPAGGRAGGTRTRSGAASEEEAGAAAGAAGASEEESGAAAGAAASEDEEEEDSHDSEGEDSDSDEEDSDEDDEDNDHQHHATAAGGSSSSAGSAAGASKGRAGTAAALLSDRLAAVAGSAAAAAGGASPPKAKGKFAQNFRSTSLQINASYVEQRIKEAERTGYDPRYSTSGQDFFLGSDPDKSLRKEGGVENKSKATSLHDIARGIQTAMSTAAASPAASRPDTGFGLESPAGAAAPRTTGRMIFSATPSPEKSTSPLKKEELEAHLRYRTPKPEVDAARPPSKAGEPPASAGADADVGVADDGTQQGGGSRSTEDASATPTRKPTSTIEEGDEVVNALELLNSSLSRIKQASPKMDGTTPKMLLSMAESNSKAGSASAEDDGTPTAAAGKTAGNGEGAGASFLTADGGQAITDVLASCKTAVDKIVSEAMKRPHLLEQGSARQQAVEKLANQIRDMQIEHQTVSEKEATAARRAEVDRLVAEMLAKNKAAEKADANEDRFAVKIITAEDREAEERERKAKEKEGSAKKLKPKKKKNKDHDKVLAYFETKYPVMTEVVQAMGPMWKQCQNDALAELIWSDQSIPAERFTKLKTYQKINHFVGMCAITRKNNLGRNLLRMKKYYPKEYRFFPDTWILPTDMSDFKAQFQQGSKSRTFIKPDNGCQGRGIFLTREWPAHIDMTTPLVAQKYIAKPFLLDGHKFDLRLYVLVTGCDPLRIYLHEKGLVRLASERYIAPKSKNLEKQMVHLTNYSINAKNPRFEENNDVEDGASGHKRGLAPVVKYLKEHYGVDTDKLFREIEDLIVKTLISIQPSLRHVYRSCQPEEVERNDMAFEILGFDPYIIDSKNKPWLLEVNHAPSFATESEVDRDAKYTVLKDTFSLLQLNPNRRKQYRRDMIQRAEARVMGNAVVKGGKLTGNKFVSGVKAVAIAAAGEKANGGGVEKSSSSRNGGTSSISSAGAGAEQITDGKEEQANEDDDDDAPINIKSKGAAADGNENVDERNDENEDDAEIEKSGEGGESAANPSEAAQGQGAAKGDSNALADDVGEDRDGSCSNNKDKTSSQAEQAPPTKVEKETKKQEALSAFPGKPPKPPGGPKVAFGRSPNKDRNDKDNDNETTTTDRKTKSLHPSKMKLTKEEEKWPTVAVPVLREMTRESKDIDEQVLETTLFRKLYPPADIGAFVNGYGKFVDCAFDIWETLTGSTSKRYRCVDWIEDQKPKPPVEKVEAVRKIGNRWRRNASKQGDGEDGEEDMDRRAQLLRSRARAAASSLPSDHSKHPMSIQSKSEVVQHRPFSSSAGTNKKAEDDGDDGGPPETELELLTKVKNDERQKPLCIAGTGVGLTSSTRESSVMFDDHGSGAAGAAQPGAIAAVVADRLRSSMGSRIGNKVDHTREQSATSGESSASALATAHGHPPPQGGRVGTASSSSSVVRYHAMFDANQLQLGGNILRTQPALPPKVSVLDAPTAPKDGSAFPGGGTRASASGNASTNGGGASGVGAPGLVGDDPQKKTTNRYAHLKPGDVVQVLTNLGWEKVVVRRKLESGRLDILFQDGETMHDVMPRLHDKVSSVLNSTRISSLQKILPGYDRQTPGSRPTKTAQAQGTPVNHGRDNANFQSAPAFASSPPPPSAGLLVTSMKKKEDGHSVVQPIEQPQASAGDREQHGGIGQRTSHSQQHRGNDPSHVGQQSHDRDTTVARVQDYATGVVGHGPSTNTQLVQHQHQQHGSYHQGAGHDALNADNLLDTRAFVRPINGNPAAGNKHGGSTSSLNGMKNNYSSSAMRGTTTAQGQHQSPLANTTTSNLFIKPMVVPPVVHQHQLGVQHLSSDHLGSGSIMGGNKNSNPMMNLNTSTSSNFGHQHHLLHAAAGSSSTGGVLGRPPPSKAATRSGERSSSSSSSMLASNIIAAASSGGHHLRGGGLSAASSNIMKTGITNSWAGSFSPNKLGEGSARRVSPQKGHFMDPAALVAKSSLWGPNARTSRS